MKTANYSRRWFSPKHWLIAAGLSIVLALATPTLFAISLSKTSEAGPWNTSVERLYPMWKPPLRFLEDLGMRLSLVPVVSWALPVITRPIRPAAYALYDVEGRILATEHFTNNEPLLIVHHFDGTVYGFGAPANLRTERGTVTDCFFHFSSSGQDRAQCTLESGEAITLPNVKARHDGCSIYAQGNSFNRRMLQLFLQQPHSER